MRRPRTELREHVRCREKDAQCLTHSRAEAVPGAPNVAVGGPGLIHMISDTAASLIDTLRPALGAGRPTIAHNLGEEPAAAAVGGGVAVGVPNEDREGFEWLSEADFNARYNIDDL